jgi:hypothetical protein
MVYSTSPLMALAKDGYRYVLKGPDPRVVFAEAAAYTLANLVDLSVPEFGLCQYGGDDRVRFASRHKFGRWRVEDMVARSANPELVGEVVPFDIWVHNEDRNISNFVVDVDSDAAGLRRLYAIDFEKSRALGGTSVFVLAGLESRTSWPKDDLAPVARACPVPLQACERIRALTAEDIEGALARVMLSAPTPGGFTLELVVRYLTARATELRQLVMEAWNG